jgi:hypothetical protein
MLSHVSTLFLSSLLLLHGCFDSVPDHVQPLKYKAAGDAPEVLAVYEAWFGHPRHISVGYSSHDPGVIDRQIHEAQGMGISGFVVDWYGDREPFIDQSYALMQKEAAKSGFKVAMMYDESNSEDDATDEAVADFTMFRQTYLSTAEGRKAYLTYAGRPVFFIFPKSGHTDWDQVRARLSSWSPAPLLIQENLPGKYAKDFDGFYAWINPGSKGWTPDGSNWGEQYLSDFYRTMGTQYPDKIIVGGAWAVFNDSKASWGLNRHISARCGQTFKDTFNYWRHIFPANDVPPFLLVETWNDYEEGTAVERGIPGCSPAGQNVPVTLSSTANAPAANHGGE